jgi:hypothetical protein
MSWLLGWRKEVSSAGYPAWQDWIYRALTNRLPFEVVLTHFDEEEAE